VNGRAKLEASMPRLLAFPILCLVLLSGCNRSAPASVAATVNGRAITFADLDKQYRYQFPTPADKPSDDQVDIQRLEILRTLIDGEIMLQRAEKGGLLATDSDVEAKFTELKSPYTQEEFQKQLNDRQMTVEDLKTQLRRDLSVQKLFTKEISSQINISDKDISEFYKANEQSFNRAEPQIHMAQILVTPAPDPNVHNLKNDKAENDTAARQKIQNLAARLKQGDDFAMLAQNYSEDPNYAQAGGDMGFIPESALEKASPELRKTIEALHPGETTAILASNEGYRILKVISREPQGQRKLDDPAVQQTIRETLMNRKDQLLKAAFYEVARNEAKVVNYYAEQIAGKHGGK
jgi:peptidyl-prolyl cis-trans isomerase SurA